jgi:hypothetical protein
MNDLEYVIAQLQDANKAAVSRATKINPKTIREIASGKNKSPAYRTVDTLMRYFKGKQS